MLTFPILYYIFKRQIVTCQKLSLLCLSQFIGKMTKYLNFANFHNAVGAKAFLKILSDCMQYLAMLNEKERRQKRCIYPDCSEKKRNVLMKTCFKFNQFINARRLHIWVLLKM